jgi:hypothetical protein
MHRRTRTEPIPTPRAAASIDIIDRPGDRLMLDDALRKLRLDRRLMERRGWIPRPSSERALAELPDVESKAAPPEIRASRRHVELTAT